MTVGLMTVEAAVSAIKLKDEDLVAKSMIKVTGFGQRQPDGSVLWFSHASKKANNNCMK